jgi:hypothetical protein
VFIIDFRNASVLMILSVLATHVFASDAGQGPNKRSSNIGPLPIVTLTGFDDIIGTHKDFLFLQKDTPQHEFCTYSVVERKIIWCKSRKENDFGGLQSDDDDPHWAVPTRAGANERYVFVTYLGYRRGVYEIQSGSPAYSAAGVVLQSTTDPGVVIVTSGAQISTVEIKTGAKLHTIDTGEEILWGGPLAPNFTSILLETASHEIRVVDLNTSAVLGSMSLPSALRADDAMVGLEIMNGNNYLAAADRRGRTVELFEVPSFRKLWERKIDEEIFSCDAHSRAIVVIGESSSILLDPATGNVRGHYAHGPHYAGAGGPGQRIMLDTAESADGKKLFIANQSSDRDDVIIVRDIDAATPIIDQIVPGRVQDIHFWMNGRWLAAMVWEEPTGNRMKPTIKIWELPQVTP